MFDRRQARIAENEIRFREINERMVRDVRDLVAPDERLLLVCECGLEQCDDSVSIEVGQYEHVRADGRHFFLVPGHEIPDVERVVERADGYSVVEKTGDSAEYVTDADPRIG